MTMKKNGLSKSENILRELLFELDTQQGNFPEGLFYSRKELSERFLVAPLTSQRILQKLQEMGYIQCTRGKRARILRFFGSPGNKSATSRLHCPRNILTLLPTPGCGKEHSVLTDAVVLRLRCTFENLGFHFFVRTCDDFEIADLKSYDGTVLLQPLESCPGLYRSLLNSGKPLAAWSWNGLALPCVVPVCTGLCIQEMIRVMRNSSLKRICASCSQNVPENRRLLAAFVKQMRAQQQKCTDPRLRLCCAEWEQRQPADFCRQSRENTRVAGEENDPPCSSLNLVLIPPEMPVGRGTERIRNGDPERIGPGLHSEEESIPDNSWRQNSRTFSIFPDRKIKNQQNPGIDLNLSDFCRNLVLLLYSQLERNSSGVYGKIHILTCNGHGLKTGGF